MVFGWPQVLEESNRPSDRAQELHTRLIGSPAPDGAALLWRVEEFFGTPDAWESGGFGVSWAPDIVDAFVADARRLLRPAIRDGTWSSIRRAPGWVTW